MLTLIVSALAAGAASAGTVPGVAYEWKNVVVGAGGFAPNIVFSRAERGLAYLRTDMGGAYRWDDGLGRWVPLQDGAPVSSHMGIESIAPDPLDPDVVYLAAGMYFSGEAAILRSGDQGATWSVVPVPFKMGGNEDGRGLGERLAIDPNHTSTLMFGSRHDGLQRSDDSGRSWRKVESFPHQGLGPPRPRRTHAGISFVLFDPSTGRPGSGSATIYAAVADPGEQHLFRSGDGGSSWHAVPGGPSRDMLPAQGELDEQGNFYIAYSTSIGPNQVKGGSIWRLDTRSGRWTDVTPVRGEQAEGGYMGLAVDPRRPGRVAVASMNRWQLGDTIWLSNDYGRSWTSLAERSRRDISAAPWLSWGDEQTEFGHWIAGLAIDPFDSGAIAYTTGATIYRTEDGLRPALTWRPWVKGVEQTAVITLVSPTGGAPLISGFGDLAGFVHDRLDVPPPVMHLNPRLSNTNNLDYAGLAPNVVVRSGALHANQPQDAWLAWSQDGGRNWQPLRIPPFSVGGEAPRRRDARGEAPIHVNADGSVFIVATPETLVTRDRGKSWQRARGFPQGARAIGDKVDPNLFYAVDYRSNRLLVSGDGARSFAPVPATGLPVPFVRGGRTDREAQWPLVATPGVRSELWFLGGGGLYRSRDAGGSFRAASPETIRIELFGLGMAAPGRRAPAIFAIAEMAGVRGVYRSTDGGARWQRINDDSHQWGLRFRGISGDPRRFGRVYVATDGRGLLYADPK